MADLAIAMTDGTSAPEFSDGQVAASPGQIVSSAPTLVAVPVAQPAAAPPVLAGMPTFEGAQVGMTEIKISGACAIEAADLIVSLDDLVRAVGVYRVVGVRHFVHPKTGETVRQQVLSPVETLVVVPFDSANPNDDGIVRARP